MIKGVNKKIIEINNTDSIYFEKAVFYLRPEVKELPAEVSHAEAKRYISQIMPKISIRKRIQIKSVIFAIALLTGIIIFLI